VHSLFLQSATLISSAGQWNLCSDLKGNGQSVSCSFQVPNDPALLVTDLGLKVNWADCIDGLILGPVFCGRQGSEMSNQLITALPEQGSTSIPTTTVTVPSTFISTNTFTASTSTTATTQVTIASTTAVTPTAIPTETTIASQSTATSNSPTNMGFIIGGVVASLFFILTVGFLVWYTRSTQSSRAQDFPQELNDSGGMRGGYDGSAPMAQSPFETRPGEPYSVSMYDPNMMSAGQNMDSSQSQWNVHRSSLANGSMQSYPAQEWMGHIGQQSCSGSVPLGYTGDPSWGYPAYPAAHPTGGALLPLEDNLETATEPERVPRRDI
jgi:hypothetical protein